MLGFIIAFWFTPRMTLGHLEFALGMTVYILLALEYEERDLVHELGEQYAAYQRRTPRLNPIRIP
jgi:protein-S-isoprenylcysteine O-methyltransferase Ste14